MPAWRNVLRLGITGRGVDKTSRAALRRLEDNVRRRQKTRAYRETGGYFRAWPLDGSEPRGNAKRTPQTKRRKQEKKSTTFSRSELVSFAYAKSVGEKKNHVKEQEEQCHSKVNNNVLCGNFT